MTEDEMVGWHHRINGHEFEQVPRGGEGQSKDTTIKKIGDIKGASHARMGTMSHLSSILISSLAKLPGQFGME